MCVTHSMILIAPGCRCVFYYSQDGRQDIPSTFPNFVHIFLIFPYLILQVGSWHTRESIGYDGTWMFKAYGVCLDFTCLVWWRNTTQYQYKHYTTNGYKLSQNNYNPSVWSAPERTAISTTLDTLESTYTGSMDVRLHLLAIPRVFNVLRVSLSPLLYWNKMLLGRESNWDSAKNSYRVIFFFSFCIFFYFNIFAELCFLICLKYNVNISNQNSTHKSCNFDDIWKYIAQKYLKTRNFRSRFSIS